MRGFLFTPTRSTTIGMPRGWDEKLLDNRAGTNVSRSRAPGAWPRSPARETPSQAPGAVWSDAYDSSKVAVRVRFPSPGSGFGPATGEVSKALQQGATPWRPASTRNRWRDSSLSAGARHAVDATLGAPRLDIDLSLAQMAKQSSHLIVNEDIERVRVPPAPLPCRLTGRTPDSESGSRGSNPCEAVGRLV